MSAENRIPPRFVIEFDYDAPLARIAEVLRAASYHNVKVTHDTGGMGKAHLRELNEMYGLNVQPAKTRATEPVKEVWTALSAYDVRAGDRVRCPATGEWYEGVVDQWVDGRTVKLRQVAIVRAGVKRELVGELTVDPLVDTNWLKRTQPSE